MVDKSMLAYAPFVLVIDLTTPSAPARKAAFFLYGAATPPVQEGKFAGRHNFLRKGEKVEWVATTELNRHSCRRSGSIRSRCFEYG